MNEGPARILVVEDDQDLNAIVSEHLSACGYRCVSAFSGTEAKLLLDGQPFDLVLCDLMLPGASGEEVLESSQDKGVPLIILSARDSATDKVTLLEQGANDYLAKPFDLEELRARVGVQLRNAAAPNRDDDCIRIGAWTIDTAARTLSIRGSNVALARIEYNIIEVLARHPNRVFTRPEIFERAWGAPYAADDNTVNVHMSTLRAKLKASGTDGYLKTVWGVGFKLVPHDD